VDSSTLLPFLSLPFIFKILLLVLIGGFTIFALVVINQIRVMNNIVNFGFFSKILLTIATVFALLAAVLFLLGLAIL
jgi:hypothetical protein